MQLICVEAAGAMHNEQVTAEVCGVVPSYQHQLHKCAVIASSASEVGRDEEQVVAERKGEKSPTVECHGG